MVDAAAHFAIAEHACTCPLQLVTTGCAFLDPDSLPGPDLAACGVVQIHQVFSDWDDLQFVGAELRHAARKAGLDDAQVEERDACRATLKHSQGAIYYRLRDTLVGPHIAYIVPARPPKLGEVPANPLDRNFYRLFQMADVVVCEFMLVAGVGKHRTDILMPVKFQG